MGKFDDVQILLEEITPLSVRVIYRVREKPIIEKIEFKGNEEIRTRTLLRELDFKEGDFFDEFEAKEAVEKIVSYYKEEGFAFVSVEFFTTLDKEAKTITITYRVIEGNRIKIAAFNVIGVVQANIKEVLKEVETEKGKMFEQRQLKEDIERIRSYYRNNGFFNVEISEPLITFDDKREKMYITIVIYEGSLYTIGDIKFEGNITISDNELHEKIGIKKGAVYSENKINFAGAAISEKYGSVGYIRANVNTLYKFDEVENKINIIFDIFEGPKVYVRNIFLDGNFITKDYVIKREFEIKEGDPFYLRKVRETQAEIFRLGFFSDVNLDVLPAGPPDKTDIVFVVTEQKTGMASIGAGYSSQDGIVGKLKVSQDNFLGRGQKLSIMWEFGGRKQNYRIDFREPWLFNTPTPFSASIFNTIRTRSFVTDDISGNYKEQRSGGSIGLGRHFTNEFTGFLKYSLEQVRIHNVCDDIKYEIPESRDITSSITPSVSYDTRDYPFNPSKGYFVRLSNQIAGGIFGGDVNFMKLELDATYFQPLFWRFVGVLNLDAGAAFAFSDTDNIPVYERFNVGGAESIRGYDWGQVGQRGGGNYKLVGNIEIKFPIVSERGRTLLQGAIFYDIGSSWNRTQDIVLRAGLEDNKLKRGFGVGVRFKIRAFPIRLDWGFGVDKCQPGGQWYFSIGDIF